MREVWKSRLILQCVWKNSSLYEWLGEKSGESIMQEY